MNLFSTSKHINDQCRSYLRLVVTTQNVHESALLITLYKCITAICLNAGDKQTSM